MNFWRFKDPSYPIPWELDAMFSPYLLVLSLIIASLACYGCLLVLERMRHSHYDKSIKTWNVCGAIVFGLGVWSMHFTGMLAFHTPIPMEYSTGKTALSLLPPMIGSYYAFKQLRYTKDKHIPLLIPPLYLALGIGIMHYLGMEAMVMQATMHYDPYLFIYLLPRF
ncbi:hypothetical protein N9R79_01815 [Vibrio sp.]|nr:hypothetical protein [Vibrio sp.]